MRESELKQSADRAKADADAAYVIQKAVQQKQVNTEAVNAEIAKPVGSIKNVRIYGAGNGPDGSGIEKISGVTPAVMKQVFDTMSDATGVDMREILKASTYDAKVNKKVELSGAVDTRSAESEDGKVGLSEKAADAELL